MICGRALTASPLDEVLLLAHTLNIKSPNANPILNLLHFLHLPLIAPLIASECPPDLYFRLAIRSSHYLALGNIDSQRREDVRVAVNI